MFLNGVSTIAFLTFLSRMSLRLDLGVARIPHWELGMRFTADRSPLTPYDIEGEIKMFIDRNCMNRKPGHRMALC
jgi:hypothetical protein